MTQRRRRILTSDERALWAHVTRHVAPLAPILSPAPGDPPPPASPAAPPPAVPPGAPPQEATASPARRAAAVPPSPPLVPLERRLRQRLARGSHPIDAVIDLHGLRQAEAHDALRAFLHRSQMREHKVVLVVTGKGAGPARDGGLFEERGVLRRSVPHWLRMPDMRGVVAGFEEAVQHHGGSGALYVRLRRHRTQDDMR